MKEIFALGIGGASFNVIELAKACGYSIGGLYHYNDEKTGRIDHGYAVLGSFKDLFAGDIRGKYFLLTMGDMSIRKELFDRITSAGGIVPTLIHPKAEVSEFADVSPNGVQIDTQAIIQADCTISDGVLICPQAMVCHQTTIDSYVFVGPKALVGARLNIGEFAFIGQNATIISTKAKSVGKYAVVGAGAVVTKPVEEHTTVVGNPAKIMGH